MQRLLSISLLAFYLIAASSKGNPPAKIPVVYYDLEPILARLKDQHNKTYSVDESLRREEALFIGEFARDVFSIRNFPAGEFAPDDINSDRKILFSGVGPLFMQIGAINERPATPAQIEAIHKHMAQLNILVEREKRHSVLKYSGRIFWQLQGWCLYQTGDKIRALEIYKSLFDGVVEDLNMKSIGYADGVTRVKFAKSLYAVLETMATPVQKAVFKE